MSVTYEVVRGVAWVTIDRARGPNALNAERAHRPVRRGRPLQRRRRRARARAHRRRRPAFCAGGDLKEMAETALQVPPPDFVPQFGRNVDVAEADDRGGERRRLRRRVPARPDVRPVRRRRPRPLRHHRGEGRARRAVGRCRFPGCVPPRVAMELLLTGDPIDARPRAHEVGLVNEVVPLADLHDAAQQLGETIARQRAAVGPRPRSRWCTAACRDARGADASTGPTQLWEPVYLSEDAQEGPRAFRENGRRAGKGRSRVARRHAPRWRDDLASETRGSSTARAPRRRPVGHADAGGGLVDPRPGEPPRRTSTKLPRCRSSIPTRSATRREAELADVDGFTARVAAEFRGRLPAPSCSPGCATPARGMVEVMRHARPVDAGAVVRARDERGVVAHRPDHGDLGPRPGRRRRARECRTRRRPRCATSRTSACAPSPTAIRAHGLTGPRRRRARRAASVPPASTWAWGPDDRDEPCRRPARSTSASSSPSGATSPTPRSRRGPTSRPSG